MAPRPAPQLDPTAVAPPPPALITTAAATRAPQEPPAETTPRVIEVPERFAPLVIMPESETARLSRDRAPAIVPDPQVDGPLMSARERRRELQRLAESMELFSVRKTSQ